MEKLVPQIVLVAIDALQCIVHEIEPMTIKLMINTKTLEIIEYSNQITINMALIFIH